MESNYIPFVWEGKENDRPNENEVITESIFKKVSNISLKLCFKDSVKVSKNSNPTLLNLQYHFQIPLHKVVNKEWVNNFVQKENFQNDERIIFIEESEQND